MIVESFFGLSREPFSIAPDPRFLYPSEQHREALELLNYGLARGASFVLLTGEIGAGKTTLWRTFLEQLPSNVDVASVVNPKLGVDALIARVFEDLHVELPAADGPVDMIDALHGHLLLAHAQGRRTLIVIDEAQALSHEVLEQLRLLTNLDSSGRKLQVLLIGQPELRGMLARPELEPLAQRIVVRAHLGALTEAQTAAYVEHRLRVAGLQGALPFDGEALGLVHRFSGGVPRRVNVLCDRALALAAEAGQRRVDVVRLERAAHDVAGPPVRPATPPSAVIAAPGGAPARVAPWAFVAGAGLALAATLGALSWRDAAPPAAAAVVAPAAPAPAATVAAAPAPAAFASAPVAAPAVAPVAAPPSPTLPPAEPASPAAAPSPLAARAELPPQALLPAVHDYAWFSGDGADEVGARRRLARLWGLGRVVGDPCAAAAAAAGLACWSGRVPLSTLRQLDRPGLLHLADERGRPGYALLVALDEDTATLQIAERREHVPLLKLARWWHGGFTTLWRPPSDTAWTARLQALDGETATDAASLARRIAGFQRARGLAVDGVAGPQTLMLLARDEHDAEPRLGR
ncbi:AAA family ATPase [Rubrivivax sp. JA1029]|uniref:ExeA family protein n=1 Tax=Rubrivivax sp. JA1029 TaxID=2894193 RepID=UPI001E47A6A4|nr:ExeA family protein [Rubrivivax sp. JA1029]MCC9648456.1 AAA family ATPase [Rubrivivax sp. JA1029]